LALYEHDGAALDLDGCCCRSPVRWLRVGQWAGHGFLDVHSEPLLVSE